MDDFEISASGVVLTHNPGVRIPRYWVARIVGTQPRVLEETA